MKNTSVLVVAAHPDDEVLGLGGTIAKLSSRGATVHLIILTDGSSAQYRDNPLLMDIIEEKYAETQACAKALKISTIDYGNFPDMKLDTVPHILLNQFIEEAVIRYSPEIVFTHFYGDINLDHQYAFRSTMVAARPSMEQSVHKIFCYRTPSSTEWNFQNSSLTFMPNYFVDISNYCQLKYQAISNYKRELRTYPHPRSMQAIQQADQAAGVRVGMLYAEEFMMIRCFASW